jgi:predicted nucleotidyltransferase
MLTDKEKKFLRELNKRKVKFMIVGLSAAVIQGAPVVTQDVDLWFRDLGDPGIKKALQKVGGIFVPSIGLNPPTLAGESVALFDIVVHMHGLDDFDVEWHRAREVSFGSLKVRVLSLEQIIRSKRATGRPKDKLAVKVLSDAVAARRKSRP